MAPKPIKVLFVLNSSAGGASQGIYEFLESMDRELIEAYLVVPDQPNERQKELFSKLAAGWRSVPSTWWNRKKDLTTRHRMIMALKSNLRTGFRLVPLVRIWRLIRRWKVDIVYTGTSLNVEGAIAAKWAGKPHIWHIKETFGPRGRVQYPLKEPNLSRFFLRHSRKVVVMTEYIRSFFHPDLSHDPKIHTVYDGIRPAMFTRSGCGKTLRSQLGVGDSDLLVAMVASLSSSWKKHHLFVEMARWLHDQKVSLKYVMFGPLPKHHRNPLYNRPWEYYQSLLSMLEGHPVGKDFLWAGFHHDIPQLMDAIDILVHPCDIEPFGRIAIEAQAAGTVVVGPQQGGISESVLHGHSGLLVPPNDVQAFGQAVMQLAQDPSLREQMGINGKTHVANTFTQSEYNSAIMDIFDAVIRDSSK